MKNNTTKLVSISEFLLKYNEEICKFFETDDAEHTPIYGEDFILTWNGMSINLGDGACVYNNLIPAIEDCYEELGDWYETEEETEEPVHNVIKIHSNRFVEIDISKDTTEGDF